VVQEKPAKVTLVCLGALAAAVAIALAAPGCRFRQERLLAVMGHNQKAVFDLQSHAGDPIEPDAIRGDLDRIDSGLASLDGDEAFRRRRDQARGVLRELRSAEWTRESRRDLFLRLTASCASCHEHYPVTRTRPYPNSSLPSAQACGTCHAEVFAEWKETLHARAWSDPVYRMSAGRPPKSECRSCHIPEPILFDRFDVSYGYRPYTRSSDLDDGVGCVACHFREDRSVAAGRTARAPCRPVADGRIRSAEFCGSCHNPTHDAYFEWKTSAAAKRGTSCVDCHLTPVDRPGGRRGWSHRFPGGDDPEMVRRAVRTSCSVESGEVVITLENLTSHKFPGEVPSRVFHILLRHDSGEETLSFRRPNKSEVGWKDNRLLPDERRTIRWKIPEGTASVAVEFKFQPSPFVLPAGWIEIGKWERRF